MNKLVVVLLVLLLTACAPSGRYSQHRDSKPDTISANIDFKDVQPVYEPYRKATLRPYTVLGKRYYPLKTSKGYSEKGVASWYGQKFHGHMTANGETYDMFSMSAAHKTLPLPSFVRVTNTQNGRQAIVRVNDRGPFHQNRVIDLSYAAALKLDVISTGTAKVIVDVVHVDKNGVVTVGNQLDVDKENNKLLFIQVAASQDEQKVKELASGLSTLYQIPSVTPNDGKLFRLRLGPITDEKRAVRLLGELIKDGYKNAYKLYEAP